MIKQSPEELKKKFNTSYFNIELLIQLFPKINCRYSRIQYTAKHNMQSCDGGHKPSLMPQVIKLYTASKRNSSNNVCQHFSKEISPAFFSPPGANISHSFSKSVTLQSTVHSSFGHILSLISQKKSSEVLCPFYRKLKFRELYLFSSDDLTSK